jgi:hypothetical protein
MKSKRSYLCLTLALVSSTHVVLYRSATGVANAAWQKSEFTSAAVLAGQNRWVKIRSPDDDFTAAFPVKPEYIFKDRPETDLTQNNHVFLAQHNGHTLMVSYTDIKLSPGEKYDEVQQRKYREEEIIRAKRKEGWELLKSTNLPGNGYQHIYFAPPKRPNDLPAYFRAITFVRGSRVYLITYDSLTMSELFGPEAKRFFDSFKFTRRK